MLDTTICGHNREALRKALEFANALDLDGISRGWPRPDNAYGALLFDIHDPAKLAAIVAELVRERGIRAVIVDIGEHSLCGNDVTIRIGDAPMIFTTESIVAFRSMPQARAFALALLDAPNATVQDVERMIGEVAR